jgi:hypothetical protein
MELVPMPQFPRTPAPAARIDPAFKARLDLLQSKLLRAAELVADRYLEIHAEAAADPEAPADVRRREMANILQIWRKCPQKTCRRTRACRGQPAHCLQACFPVLPKGTLDTFVASTRRRRRRAR